MSGSVNIGCSGYSYAHWRGNFYPPGLPDREFLEFYSSRFSCVELNITFYQTPPENFFRSWAARTPDHFGFALKGSRYITHVRHLNVSTELDYFFRRARLLGSKLRAVLWQLPPVMAPDLPRLQRFLEQLKAYRAVPQFFEFRHPGWLDIPTLQLLLDYEVGICGSDWPEASCPELWCGRAVYFRRHGPAVYSGSYDSPALLRDAELLRTHAAFGRETFLFFNNDLGGMAPANAAETQRLVARSAEVSQRVSGEKP